MGKIHNIADRRFRKWIWAAWGSCDDDTDAMNYQTRTDQAPWTVQVLADRSEWHRWRPVICDDAPGGVAWGLTIWRRHKRGQWEYQIEPGSEDDHRVGRLGRPITPVFEPEAQKVRF